MDNSILVTQYIQQFLEENSELTALTGADGIFSIQMPKKLNYPFVMYQRSIYPQYTKTYGYTGWSNEVQVEIVCVSDKYVQSLEVANIVRNCLELRYFTDETIKIEPIEIQSVNEYAVDSDSQTAYVQSIVLSITVK